MTKLRVESLESRVTPVVGAFAPAATADVGTIFDGVVHVFVTDGSGTGTLLSTGRHMLTAAHVVDDDGDEIADGPAIVRFDLPTGSVDLTVFPSDIFVWPGSTGAAGLDGAAVDVNDLAILTLPELAPSGSGGAGRFDLYRGADEVGQTFLSVGYGRTGTGFSGGVEGTSGERRLGYNRFDTTGAFAPDDALVQPGLGLASDFDDGTPGHDTLGQQLGAIDVGYGAQEAGISLGDSGGPAFLVDGAGNYRLAGVAANLVSGGQFDIDADLGRIPDSNSSFGDLFGFTRVSAYAAAIDGLISGAYDLTIDLNHQSVGNDGVLDSVAVTLSGDSISVTVNGQLYHAESRALIRSVTVIASSDGGTFAVGATVPSDLLVREVGFAPPVDARPVVNAAPRVELQQVAVVSPAFTTDLYAVGADAGNEPRVRVFDGAGAVRFDFLAFDSAFTGGVRVAVGDVNGDGYPDVVAGTGPGGFPIVRIIDGQGRGILDEFLAFEESFAGGLYVATADFDGDGLDDIVVSPDEGGGPRVRVIDGATITVFADFFGIDDPNFRGGARVNVGDLNGDAVPDLLVAAGFGGGPHVAIFDGTTLATEPSRLVADFFVFEPDLRNGIFVASGDIDGDGFAEVIAGGGPGGGPRVFALSGEALLVGAFVQVANFFASEAENRGGVRVAVKDVDRDGFADIVTGSGPDVISQVAVYVGALTPTDSAPVVRLQFDPFLEFLVYGVYVG